MIDNSAALDALKKKISDLCCAAREGSPEQRYAQDAFAILEGMMPTLTIPRAPGLPEAVREQSMQWQPIDTAPKDGTEILVIASGGEVVISAYRPLNVEGSGFGSIHSCCGYYEDLEPTHWMPIPKSPKALHAGTEGDDNG